MMAESFDLPILDWIAANLWCPLLDTLMPIITMLGDAGLFWIALSVILLIPRKTRRVGLGMGLSLMMGLLLCNVTLKPLCQRIRPYDYQEQVLHRVIPLIIEKQHDFSFPSGHATNSLACAWVMFRLLDKKYGIPALVLALLISFSRLYVGVHFPTDVLAGALVGMLSAWIVYKGKKLLSHSK